MFGYSPFGKVFFAGVDSNNDVAIVSYTEQNETSLTSISEFLFLTMASIDTQNINMTSIDISNLIMVTIDESE